MSKGRSSILQKRDAARKRMYTLQQYLDYTKCGCDASTRPPSQEVLDRIEDEKLSGRFDVRRSNQCQTCYQVRSKNGSCGCP